MAYATITDLTTHGASSATFGSLSTLQKQGAVDAACAEADGYLRARYPRTELPLPAPYDPSLVQAVIKIATFECLRIRGFNPNAGSDALIVEAANVARSWLRQLARGETSLVIAPDVSSMTEQPRVISTTRRGW